MNSPTLPDKHFIPKKSTRPELVALSKSRDNIRGQPSPSTVSPKTAINTSKKVVSYQQPNFNLTSPNNRPISPTRAVLNKQYISHIKDLDPSNDKPILAFNVAYANSKSAQYPESADYRTFRFMHMKDYYNSTQHDRTIGDLVEYLIKGTPLESCTPVQYMTLKERIIKRVNYLSRLLKDKKTIQITASRKYEKTEDFRRVWEHHSDNSNKLWRRKESIMQVEIEVDGQGAGYVSGSEFMPSSPSSTTGSTMIDEDNLSGIIADDDSLFGRLTLSQEERILGLHDTPEPGEIIEGKKATPSTVPSRRKSLDPAEVCAINPNKRQKTSAKEKTSNVNNAEEEANRFLLLFEEERRTTTLESTRQGSVIHSTASRPLVVGQSRDQSQDGQSSLGSPPPSPNFPPNQYPVPSRDDTPPTTPKQAPRKLNNESAVFERQGTELGLHPAIRPAASSHCRNQAAQQERRMALPQLSTTSVPTGNSGVLQTPVMTPAPVGKIFLTFAKQYDGKYVADLRNPIPIQQLRISLSAFFDLYSSHSGVSLAELKCLTFSLHWADYSFIEPISCDATEEHWGVLKDDIRRLYKHTRNTRPDFTDFQIWVDIGDKKIKAELPVVEEMDLSVF